MSANNDMYAKGMVESGEEHFDLTPELDRFQYRMIKPHLSGQILEIGAGPGRLARLLVADGLPFEHYVCSEPSDHFFGQLQRRVAASQQVSLVQGDTASLSARYQSTFDAIFSAHVLEHVENDRRFVEDCFSMLKPGGKLITLVPAMQWLYSDLDRNIGHYRRYDKGMVRRLIAGTGFNVERIYYTNFLAIIPSLLIFKMRKLDYQKSTSNKSQFMSLERAYSKYAIPVIDVLERNVPLPAGLNLTFVLEKMR